MTSSESLTSTEWVRLASYYATTSSGLALTPEQSSDCDALAARIKIPRPISVPKPGTPPVVVPIAAPPRDSESIA